MLDARQREIAELFARMASTPILSESDAKAARDDFVGGEMRTPGFEEISKRARANFTRALVRFHRAYLSKFGDHKYKAEAEWWLPTMWLEAWTVLNRLLEGLPAEPRRSYTSLRLENGVLRGTRIDGGWPFYDFYGILRAKPFPFARCPTCRTIFVRVRRQRYCTRQCASRGLEAARKGTRREYMRELMHKKRERERQKQKREQKRR